MNVKSSFPFVDRFELSYNSIIQRKRMGITNPCAFYGGVSMRKGTNLDGVEAIANGMKLQFHWKKEFYRLKKFRLQKKEGIIILLMQGNKRLPPNHIRAYQLPGKTQKDRKLELTTCV